MSTRPVLQMAPELPSRLTTVCLLDMISLRLSMRDVIRMRMNSKSDALLRFVYNTYNIRFLNVGWLKVSFFLYFKGKSLCNCFTWLCTFMGTDAVYNNSMYLCLYNKTNFSQPLKTGALSATDKNMNVTEHW